MEHIRTSTVFNVSRDNRARLSFTGSGLFTNLDENQDVDSLSSYMAF